jgi:hypothetical protein
MLRLLPARFRQLGVVVTDENHFAFQSWFESMSFYAKYWSVASSRI